MLRRSLAPAARLLLLLTAPALAGEYTIEPSGRGTIAIGGESATVVRSVDGRTLEGSLTLADGTWRGRLVAAGGGLGGALEDVAGQALDVTLSPAGRDFLARWRLLEGEVERARGEERWRFVPPPTRRRGSVIRVDDVHFDHDSAIPLPSALPVVATALEALWQAQAAGEVHPALVAGHTDTSGSAAYNLRLARQRAESVRDLLLGREAAWVAGVLAQPRAAQVRALEQLAAWAARLPRAPETITAAGEPAREQWEAVFRFYQDQLAAAYVGLDPATLARVRGAIVFVPGGEARGFGESRPLVPTGDGVRCEKNRRVELFFFPPGHAPGPGELERVFDRDRWTIRPLPPRRAASVFERELPPGDLVFLLDVSGSMQRNPLGGSGGPITRLLRCQQQLLRLIDDLPAARRFGIVAFDDELKIFRSDATDARLPALVTADAATKEAAKSWVLALEADRGTQGMQRAIGRGLAALRGHEGLGRSLLLLSDGLPSFAQGQSAETLAAKVLHENAAGPDGARPFTIGTWGFTAQNERGVALLERLARENGGAFTAIDEGTMQAFPDDRVHVNLRLCGDLSGATVDPERVLAGANRILAQAGVTVTHDVAPLDAAALSRAGDDLVDASGRAVCRDRRARHLLAPDGIDLYADLGVEGEDGGIDAFLVHHFEEPGVLGKSPTPGRMQGSGPGTGLVVAAFENAGDGRLRPLGVDAQAQTLAHELAHFLGLPHVEDRGNLLFPRAVPGATRLTSEQGETMRRCLAIHPH